MKKIVLVLIAMICLVTGCTKENKITFVAQIESLGDQSMMVTTNEDLSFDKASVGLKGAQIQGDLVVGANVEITIHPEVKESYPVQVTAIKVEVMEAGYQKISAEKAKEMIEKDEHGLILDVRTLDEYKEGHIEGAVLLPNDEIREKAETTLYDKEEVILVYCRSGNRSEAAARELIDMGYINVYDFGGIMDWPYGLVKE